MLMALLYTERAQIIAAAPACDQVPHGDKFWLDFHESRLSSDDLFETALMFVADPNLQSKLLRVGIDESVDSQQLTREVELRISPMRSQRKAA